jgi:hypothetical protein
MNDFLIDCFFKECCGAPNCDIVLGNAPELCDIVLKNCLALCGIAVGHFVNILRFCLALCGIALDQSSAMRHSAKKLSSAMRA